MGSEWRTTTLGNVLTLQRGHDLTEQDRKIGSVPVIGSAGLNGWHNEAKAKGPGVTIGRSGASAGVITFVTGDFWPHNTSLFVTDFQGNDPRFCFYWLRTLSLANYNSGSAQPSLNRNHLYRIPVRIPPLSEQRAISSNLGALDDKIDLNRRMNETLEAMARAIFKRWFADSSTELLVKRVQQLINEGILAIGDGYRAKNSEMGYPGLPFLRAGNLKNGFSFEGADSLHETSISAAKGKLSQAGDVAFTSKGTIGRLSRVGDHTEKFVYSPQVCFWRTTDSIRLRPSILYAWMLSNDFQDQLDGVSGQTDMAPYVSLQDQRLMKMPVFGKSQHATADAIDPLFTRQSHNIAESKMLAELRDLLLPKLMSGEVRIKEAEKALETVL